MAGARRGLALAAIVLMLAGCSGSAAPAATVPTDTAEAASAPATISVPPNPAQQALSGYLALATNGVVFLQWTQSGDTLTGTLTQAYTDPGNPAALKHQNGPFTGVLSGGSVTLNFPQGLGLSTAWSGTLNGDTLILSYSAPDGSLSTLTFGPGTVADYNAALARVQGAAGAAAAQQDAAASAAAADRAQAAAAAAAQARLDDAVRSASVTLDGALGRLSDNVGNAELSVSDMTQGAASANAALSTVRAALVKVEQEAAVRPMDSYQQSSVCYEVSGVTYEVTGVTYFTDPVRTQGGIEAQAAASARAAATEASTAIAALESALAADPGGPAPDVSPATARATIKDQTTKLAGLDSKAATAIKSAAASDSTAAGLLTQAQQVATSVGASC